MVEKILLKNGAAVKGYVLEPILSRNERHDGAYPVTISYESVSNRFIIFLSQQQDEHCIFRNLDIADNEKELLEKLYTCALNEGRNYAAKLKCPLIVETTRAKESKLIATSQSA